jgi:hypothetical protein
MRIESSLSARLCEPPPVLSGGALIIASVRELRNTDIVEYADLYIQHLNLFLNRNDV